MEYSIKDPAGYCGIARQSDMSIIAKAQVENLYTVSVTANVALKTGQKIVAAFIGTLHKHQNQNATDSDPNGLRSGHFSGFLLTTAIKI
jgi:hypothetical protein